MVADYWYVNPARWKRVLLRAADIADMYELERPDRALLRDKEPTPYNLCAFRDGMYWHTTHRRMERRIQGLESVDLMDEDADFDAPTAWACTVGLIRELDLLSLPDLRYTLKVSAGRQHEGWKRWRGYSEDFRKMMRCLSGDLAKPAVRHLVLGIHKKAKQR